MKMLEQTKRAISVGLITAACVVIVAAATLFCGVTAARAQEPDNRIDWRWGRPGVMVVTNAPTAVTVTNIATKVATEVAGGVAENLFGPRVTALEGGTNNWNAAYGWGNHAGLYRVIGWVPSWGDLTDIPQDFPPSTHEHDYTTITNPPWLTSFTETDEIALSRVTVLEGKTNNWNAAFGWGDHAGLYKGIGWFPSWTEVTGKPATFPPETHQHDHTAITNPPWLTDIPPLDAVLAAGNVAGGSIAITNTAAGYDFRTELYDSGLLLKMNGDTVLDVGVGGTGGIRANPFGGIYLGDNPVVYGISVNGGEPLHGDVELSIIQAESDPVAMAALTGYQSAAYWPPNATASSWFTFTTNANEITITSYDMDGGADVIIPDYINGWPVTTIGVTAFSPNLGGLPVTSVNIPSGVTSIGDAAFAECSSLTSVTFSGPAPTAGADMFANLATNQVTNYVTNPQATGWGEMLGDMPVVRLPLYGDKIYQAGLPVATEAHVAEQIAAIEFPVASTNYTAWTGTVTPAAGTATVAIAHGNMPVLVTDAPCVLTLDPTGYGTGGVSRVSLSYYPGTNSFTFATNIIKYAETPTVDTNGWNTLLIRRVSNSDWKGVGL